MIYDTIIVGASFAGLSVAGQLKGRVLLIDRLPVGSRQTSACATYYLILEKTNCLDALEKIHEKVYVNTPGKRIEYRLHKPFCTFNYDKFCRLLFDRLQVDFIQAKVLYTKNNQVITDKGTHSGHVLVDCSGWQTALSKNEGNGRLKPNKYLSFGLESPADIKEDGLSFYFDPKFTGKGYGWVFPTSNASLAGLITYEKNQYASKNLKNKLSGFFENLNSIPKNIHGNYLPAALSEPILADNIFAAGDSAGHCIAATGEGIRPAIFFGEQCGRLIQQIADNHISAEKAVEQYRDLIFSRRKKFDQMRHFQWLISHTPSPLFTQIAKWSANPDRFSSIMRRYDSIVEPETIIGPITKRGK